jgi:hypothetical protein|tara:strand:- start:186 stop:1058 length:873 start_codon:yes stop_codon:yes gene_type:complete
VPVHGDNIKTKLIHSTKYKDKVSKKFIEEISLKYLKWKDLNLELKGPFKDKKKDDLDIVEKRVQLFNEYKDFIDQKKYAEKFDSRSNLHSSVLEEFLEYLFFDVVMSIDKEAIIGKSHTFKDIFFKGKNFKNIINNPTISIEKKDHDFVIGVNVIADFKTKKSEGVTVEEKFDLPIVAIECKTYLDKTMLEGASTSGSQMKMRNPNALYLVCAEWLKLTDSINLNKIEVDQIYILRKQKNTDREFRYNDDYKKKPIYSDVVWKMFEKVRDHITVDWEKSIKEKLTHGVLK